ncbi:MAG: hypothetical protein U1A22_04740 [Xanthomonadaceae bacterium]|nr:hypothetical protein [Xanthomonadaceae bacterium]
MKTDNAPEPIDGRTRAVDAVSPGSMGNNTTGPAFADSPSVTFRERFLPHSRPAATWGRSSPAGYWTTRSPD